MLEVQQRQPEQLVEHLPAQHGVDALPGVQHEVLPHPAQDAGEQHEHRHRNRERYQRRLRAMHDDLVDDHLSEERQRKTHQLQDERCRQYLAPHTLVAEQLRDEPAQSEARLAQIDAVRVDGLLGRGHDRQREAAVA